VKTLAGFKIPGKTCLIKVKAKMCNEIVGGRERGRERERERK
jgi:hypothetical protein